jgi:hypothetical protein
MALEPITCMHLNYKRCLRDCPYHQIMLYHLIEYSFHPHPIVQSLKLFLEERINDIYLLLQEEGTEIQSEFIELIL